MFRFFLLSIFLFFSFAFALEVQKPQIYDDQNISGWLMSEKLDGIRGYWDGEKLYTKNGNLIYAPKWFTKDFPPFALDGELWSKRDDFSFIQSTVLDLNASNDWEKITYNIFEVPNTKGDFLSRLQIAKEWFETHPNSYANFIEQIVCHDENELQNYLAKIVSLKGEGIIIKDGKLPYHTGRSPFILKVKQVQDMEGKVIGYNYDKFAKFKSLKLKLDNGVIFNLGGGISEDDKLHLPKIGEMVTFKYYGFTNRGVPKFASFLRVRKKE